jgi:hypothetical protein
MYLTSATSSVKHLRVLGSEYERTVNTMLEFWERFLGQQSNRTVSPDSARTPLFLYIYTTSSPSTLSRPIYILSVPSQTGKVVEGIEKDALAAFNAFPNDAVALGREVERLCLDPSLGDVGLRYFEILSDSRWVLKPKWQPWWWHWQRRKMWNLWRLYWLFISSSCVLGIVLVVRLLVGTA